jgi:hypothetical protein
VTAPPWVGAIEATHGVLFPPQCQRGPQSDALSQGVVRVTSLA